MSDSRIRSLGPSVLVAAGLLIVVDQLAAVLPQLYPFRFDIPIWRYQALLLLVGRLTPVLFAAALIIAGTALAGSRGSLRALGVLTLVLALVMVIVAGGFLLDAVELRRVLNQEEKARFTINSARVLGTLGLATLFCTWLGVVLFRTPADHSASRNKDEAPSLVVGGPRREGSA